MCVEFKLIWQYLVFIKLICKMNEVIIQYNINIIYNSLISHIKDSKKYVSINEKEKSSVVFSYIEENINLLLNLSLNFKNKTFESLMNSESKRVFVNYITMIANYFMKYLKNSIDSEKMKKKIVIIYILCKKCVEFEVKYSQNDIVLDFLKEYSLHNYNVKIECLIDCVMNTKGELKVDFDGKISNLYLFS